jgi:hypothetical protein
MNVGFWRHRGRLAWGTPVCAPRLLFMTRTLLLNCTYVVAVTRHAHYSYDQHGRSKTVTVTVMHDNQGDSDHDHHDDHDPSLGSSGTDVAKRRRCNGIFAEIRYHCLPLHRTLR